MNAILIKPSTWIPIVMPLAMLAIIIIHIARFGIARQADEGTAAHLFQQIPTGRNFSFN